jgi:hypothetical protein
MVYRQPVVLLKRQNVDIFTSGVPGDYFLERDCGILMLIRTIPERMNSAVTDTLIRCDLDGCPHTIKRL